MRRVERTFSWIGRNRRMSRDYERLIQTSEMLLYAAMARVMLRRLANKQKKIAQQLGWTAPTASVCQGAVVRTRIRGAARDEHQHDWHRHRQDGLFAKDKIFLPDPARPVGSGPAPSAVGV